MTATSVGRRLLLAVLGLAAAGCVATPVPTRAAPPPVGPELLTHFRIERAPADDAAATGGPHVLGTPDAARAGGDVVTLEDVLRSVETHFPLVLAAYEEIGIAAGKAEAAAGAFDTRLTSKGAFEVDGYYENDRIDVAVEQPTTWWGTRFEAGWRRGDGDFAVYDGKAKTNRDGELRAGLTVPLLQGRTLDPERVKLLQGGIERDRASPLVQEKRLAATRKAAASYWKWIAAGEKRRIAASLLQLAEDRQGQVQTAVTEGQLAEINLVDNERLIVDRRSKLEAAEQVLRQAAIELSLYWRDDTGEPVVPTDDERPATLPDPRALDAVLVEGDEYLALAQRPELRRLELEIEAMRLELELAGNDLLPKLDFGVFGSQDYGGAVNSPDDKDPFELKAVVSFDVPLQRRKARGQQSVVDGKLAKMEQELRYAASLVVAEVRDAVAVLEQTLARLEQARTNVRLAHELEEAERLQLELGESDLFRVNVREQQTAIAEAGLVDVLAEHFVALTTYRAVLGVPYDEVVAGARVGGD